MSGARGPDPFLPSHVHSSPPVLRSRPRAEATGAHLLVVDPVVEADDLTSFMAGRGVRVTAVGSTLDALVEFGRTRAAAVVVAPDATGPAPAEFVQAIRRFGSPYVIAVVDPAQDRRGPGPVLDGCGVLERPYDAATVWHLLQGSGQALDGLALGEHAEDDQALVSFGPIELDTRAFTVRVRGERIHDLPLKEFELLRVLMCRAPEIMSNDELRLSLWGKEGNRILDNTLAVHVARLRNRLQGIARIRRIRGRGYALTLD